jgi:hypothetical protein
MVFARKGIETGEELTFNYKNEYPELSGEDTE